MSIPIYVDIETISTSDLPKVGVEAYAADPSTEIDIVCWARGNGEVQEGIAGFLEAVKEPNTIIVAHNSSFEITLFKAAGHDLTGKRWLCTSRLANWLGLPGSLDPLGKYLLGESKDAEGRAVLEKRIRNPEQMLDANERALLIRYCKKDVDLTRKCLMTMLDIMAEGERNQFMQQQADDVTINAKGIPVDVELMLAAALRVTELQQQADKDTEFVTRRIVRKATQRAKIVQWLISQGDGLKPPEKTSVEDVVQLIDQTRLTANDKKRLAHAVKIGGSQSLAKWARATGRTHNGRVHGAYAFAKQAHGRWSSYSLQAHNFPRGAIALDAPACKSATPRDLVEGMRNMIRVQDPHRLVISDYRQVEARVLMWLAGEQNILDGLAAGEDPYKVMAARMYRCDITNVTPEKRQFAKSSFLGCGYGMSAKGFAAYAGGPLDEATKCHTAYHRAAPNVAKLHAQMDMIAKAAAGKPLLPETRLTHVDVTAWTEHTAGRKAFCLRLPSARIIRLWDPKLDGKGNVEVWSHGKPSRIWGGALTGYVCCGIARDLLARTLTRCEAAGLPVVAHTHDEVIVEIHGDRLIEYMPGEAVKHVESMMLDPDDPVIYDGLPLAVESRLTPTWGVCP